MPTPRRAARTLLAVAVVTLGATACSSDDEPEAVASDAGTDRPCEAVGSDLEPDAVTSVAVELHEYEFTPASLEAPAGIVTFATENTGVEAHELALLPGGGDVPLTEAGAPDEEALEAAGAFELEAYGPDQTCNASYELDPGTYTVFCLVEAADGETHLEKGMEGTLTAE
ncbi:MAG: cupredoxin domain-containing protein [Acidimicrobiales bacterium]